MKDRHISLWIFNVFMIGTIAAALTHSNMFFHFNVAIAAMAFLFYLHQLYEDAWGLHNVA